MGRLILHFIKLLLKNLSEILFPEFCVGCGTWQTLLCHQCYETLEFSLPQFEVQKKQPLLDSLSCCSSYSGISSSMIHEYKYKSVIALGKLIARILFYTTPLPRSDLITFVPIHPKKTGLRGFNQTKIIAQELGQLTQTPVVELLIKTKHTRSQMSLKQKSAREANIAGTISMHPQVTQSLVKTYASVLLVDDVFTSGTTLGYCAQILKSFGFSQVHGVCFASRS